MLNLPETERERSQRLFPRTFWSDHVQAEGFDHSSLKPVGWIPDESDVGWAPRTSDRGESADLLALYKDGTFGRFRLAKDNDRFHEVRPGYWFERNHVFRSSDEDESGRLIAVTISLNPSDRRVAITEITIDSIGQLPLMAQDLRNVSLTSIMRGINWDSLFMNPTPTNNMPRVLQHLEYPILGVEAAKHGPSDSALEALAIIHEVAEILSRPAVLEVAAEMQLTRSTAGRWISTARKKGFLAKADE